VPFNASGADAAPMNAVIAACKKNGLYPFTHFNRVQSPRR
jgi:taurine--2-oxoglutarate transaminase